MFYSPGKVEMIDKGKIFTKSEPKDIESNSGHDVDMLNFDDEIQYSWTRDKSDIAAYTRLIDDSYAEEINFADSYKKIDTNDINSHFFIGKINEVVVGGIRLSLHDAITDSKLPTETQGIFYKEIFKELNLESNNYCELTRYGVNKDHRNSKKHYIECLSQCRQIMEEKRIKYLFIPSSLSRVKLYNLFASKFFKTFPPREFSKQSPEPKEYSQIQLSSNDHFAIGLYELKTI